MKGRTPVARIIRQESFVPEMTIHQELPSNLDEFVAALDAGRNEKSEATKIAVEFLKRLDPDGWHSLVTISPKTGAQPVGKTFAPNQWDAIAQWLSAHVGLNNCYFTLNEPRVGAPNKKLAKTDIVNIRGIGADVDPPDGVQLDAARTKLQDDVDKMRFNDAPPTVAIDSGGGCQTLWLLSEKLPCSTYQDEAENQGRAIAEFMNGDKVHSVDHLYRLPGPMNIPNESKTARGRTPRTAKVLYDTNSYCTLGSLASWVEPTKASRPLAADADVAAAEELIDIDEVLCAHDFSQLPAELQDRFRAACKDNPRLARLWEGDKTALHGNDFSGSGWRASLARLIAGAWTQNFGAMEYAQLAYVWPYANLQLKDDNEVHRQVSRDWGRLAVPETSEAKIRIWFENPPLLEEPLFPTDPTPARNDVFKFLTIRDIANRPDQKYLIGRYIPENSLGFIYAMSGAGKTFLALDIALALAYGRPDWHGEVIRAPEKATVVYIAGEGVSGLKARIAVWKHHHGIAIDDDADGRFLLLPQAVNMMIPEQVEKLARSIRQSVVGPIAAIFVDTVSRAIPGADENLQKEMSKFIEACEAVKRGASCAVIGIHHTNKAGDMRGSGVLDGGLDFIFKLTRAKGATIGKLYCEKMKDGPDGWFDHFSFDEITTAGGMTSLVPTRVSGAHEGGSELTPEITRKVLEAIDTAWNAGEPWALAPQAKDRYAVRRLVQDFKFDMSDAEEAVHVWVGSGFIKMDRLSARNKKMGLRLVNKPTLEGADDASAFD